MAARGGRAGLVLGGGQPEAQGSGEQPTPRASQVSEQLLERPGVLAGQGHGRDLERLPRVRDDHDTTADDAGRLVAKRPGVA